MAFSITTRQVSFFTLLFAFVISHILMSWRLSHQASEIDRQAILIRKLEKALPLYQVKTNEPVDTQFTVTAAAAPTNRHAADYDRSAVRQ